MGSSPLIDRFLRDHAKPMEEGERIEAAQQIQALRFGLAVRLFTVPASVKAVDGWHAMKKNERGFSVPKKHGIADWRTLLPRIQAAMEGLRASRKADRAKADKSLRSLLETLIIDIQHLDEVLLFLEDLHDRLVPLEREIENLARGRGHLLDFAERQERTGQGNLFLAEIPGFSAKYARLRALRAEAGMPLADIAQALDEARALKESYLKGRSRFWTRNSKVIATTIRQKARAMGMRSEEIRDHFDEIFAYVCVDCLPALDRFDPTSGKLSTFLETRIYSAMRCWNQDRRNVVRMDYKMAKLQGRIARLFDRCEAEGLPKPSDGELAGILGIKEDVVPDILRMMRGQSSLDAPIASEEGEDGCLGDKLAAEGASPEDAAADGEFIERIRAIQERVLSPQQLRVLRRLSGQTGQEYSRGEVGALECDENGAPLSQDQIGQIFKRAKKTLAKDREYRALLGFDQDEAPKAAQKPERPFEEYLVEEMRYLGLSRTISGWDAWPHEDEGETWHIASVPPAFVVETRMKAFSNRRAPALAA